MTRYPSISFIVPVYNSQDSLPYLVEQISDVFAHHNKWEIVLVNDGSRDQSWTVVCKLSRQYPEYVHGINLARNFGQHNALLCGIRAAQNDVIVTLDDDLQHPPEEVPKLLDKLAEGFDVVYGYPEHEQHGLLRDLASQVTKIVLQGTMGLEHARTVGPFRAFYSSLRGAFETYYGPYVLVDMLLTWGTSNFAAVPVRHEPRTIGQSNYTFSKLIKHALNMITGFSVLPLQIATYIGLGFSLFGILILLYVLGRYLVQGTVVPGFVFLASTIAIFSGVQLFTIGIIGEYLARMYTRIIGRPAYIEKQHTKAS